MVPNRMNSYLRFHHRLITYSYTYIIDIYIVYTSQKLVVYLIYLASFCVFIFFVFVFVLGNNSSSSNNAFVLLKLLLRLRSLLLPGVLHLRNRAKRIWGPTEGTELENLSFVWEEKKSNTMKNLLRINTRLQKFKF